MIPHPSPSNPSITMPTPDADLPPLTLTLGALGPQLLLRALANYENQIHNTLANPRSKANPDRLEAELASIASLRDSITAQTESPTHPTD